MDFDAVASKWGCTYEEASAMLPAGLRLNSLDAGYDVETVDTVLTKSPGLGVALTEVANNGEGVGIVCVEDLVAGSPAALDGKLRVGDVVTNVGPPGGPFVKTEGATYDATLAAIVGAGDVVAIEAKRLVKRAMVTVTLKYPNDEEPETTIEVYRGENLRRAMLVRGVKLNDPLARRFDSLNNGGDCGAEGTCCTCAVAVMQGAEFLSDAQAQERQMLKPTPRWRLACKARVGLDMGPGDEGDLVLRVSPRQHQVS